MSGYGKARRESSVRRTPYERQRNNNRLEIVEEEVPVEVETKKPSSSYFQQLSNLGSRLVGWFAYSSAVQDSDEDTDDNASDNNDNYEDESNELRHSNGIQSPQAQRATSPQAQRATSSQSQRAVSPPQPSLRVSTPTHRSPMATSMSPVPIQNQSFQSPSAGGDHHYYFVVGQPGYPNFQLPGGITFAPSTPLAPTPADVNTTHLRTPRYNFASTVPNTNGTSVPRRLQIDNSRDTSMSSMVSPPPRATPKRRHSPEQETPDLSRSNGNEEFSQPFKRGR